MRYKTQISWLTCLSLDAPLVAIVWQNAVSTNYGFQIDWYHRVLVFLSVWLGYSADRWFDAWRHEENVSQRHRFFSNYRWPLLFIWAAVLVGAFALALYTLNATELAFGITLSLSSIAITFIVQFFNLRRYRSLTKSLLTATLVTASVLLFALPDGTNERTSTLFLLLAIFTLNCSFIHSWDRPIDSLQEKRFFDSTRNGSLKISFVLASIAMVVSYDNPLFIYTLTSTFLLTAIHFFENRIHLETRRTLADLCLLTPLAAFL
tara:strand:- start:996 stop:1784 length:789 start_codon:yes stop_codon:yes gene_type:complete